MIYLYSAHFIDSGVIEYVVTPFSLRKKNRDTSQDIVFKSYETASKSEWREYFQFHTIVLRRERVEASCSNEIDG